ncbi:hypothetical protein [Micromonospora sp. C31]|uniref:hypothetical protein n=1 Tax=Micromonospora sp. C31 TaxID=2824876 RepID=UPI001FFCA37E|nr:hypothetical protein [Micromonospora sp. C31]
MLLTPPQSAGEEYGVTVHGRTRRDGSVHHRLVLVLWTGLAIITWRTGGLEITVVLHAALNTFTFVLATAL